MNKKAVFHFGFVLCLFFYSSFLQAQELAVKNVRFEDQGETLVVRYDLDGLVGKNYEVTLLLSDDGGDTFSIRPMTIYGDVGKNVKPGTDKSITWHLKQDYPQGLSGERFAFAVDAELQKGGGKWSYYVLGSGVVGGVVYFLTKGKEETTPTGSTTGSIVVDVPKNF